MALGLNRIGLLCLSNKHECDAAVFMPAHILDYLLEKSKRICRSEISDNTLPPQQGFSRLTAELQTAPEIQSPFFFRVLYTKKKKKKNRIKMQLTARWVINIAGNAMGLVFDFFIF